MPVFIIRTLTAVITYNEQELVTLLRQRNEQSFTYLYDHYSAALNGIIKQIIKEEETANDVLQEVFINIWKKIETYDSSKGRLFTWMLNIARNASIDKIRSTGYQNERKNQPLPENVNEMTGLSAGQIMDDYGLKKLLGKLKEEQRVLLELSYFQGFTHEEISKALKIPLGTVKTRIRAALIQLRGMI